ncbi:hypothetical protein [Chryseobacterium sp. JV274]|uniref:hypothetical protein n=1 Tax=Chryseobacterium sp. JV274 TaxID=1932669 RepID=UPI0015C295EB|nr:hypothetical protein [Chryseobacterium sp. JV274]CAD0220362.1 protein of unknown function [Chryseobacterium sp. JV274]
MKERYFFISYSIRTDKISGYGNWGYITRDGKFFNKKIVGKSIAEKSGFNEENVVILNFKEFNNESDLNNFFDLKEN